MATRMWEGRVDEQHDLEEVRGREGRRVTAAKEHIHMASKYQSRLIHSYLSQSTFRTMESFRGHHAHFIRPAG